MTNAELIKKIEELKEMEALIKEAQEEVEALKDELKAEMQKRDEAEEMKCGKYVVRWTSVITERLDTTALKKAMPSVCNMYMKQSHSRRFSISG